MERFLNTQLPLGRIGFTLGVLLVLFCAAGLAHVAFHSLGEGHATFPLACFCSIVAGFLAISTLLLLCVRRMKETHWQPMSTLLLLLPGFNVVYLVALALAAPKKQR